jgi:anti-anti-sigma factor
LLVVSRWIQGAAMVVKVDGEVDNLTTPRLWAALDETSRPSGVGRVVVDLLGVTFMASAGVVVLSRAAEQTRRRRELLRVVTGEHRRVVRPMEITGLRAELTLCRSLNEALVA